MKGKKSKVDHKHVVAFLLSHTGNDGFKIDRRGENFAEKFPATGTRLGVVEKAVQRPSLGGSRALIAKQLEIFGRDRVNHHAAIRLFPHNHERLIGKNRRCV